MKDADKSARSFLPGTISVEQAENCRKLRCKLLTSLAGASGPIVPGCFIKHAIESRNADPMLLTLVFRHGVLKIPSPKEIETSAVQEYTNKVPQNCTMLYDKIKPV